MRYARDTWHSVAEMARGTPLAVDSLMRGTDGSWKPARKTTPTDIGAYLWSTLAAERLQLIGKSEAEQRVKQTLDALDRIERIHGFYFDRIDPFTRTVLRVQERDGSPRPRIVSCVDNGWLAAGLIMVRNSCPSLRISGGSTAKRNGVRLFLRPVRPGSPDPPPGQCSWAISSR